MTRKGLGLDQGETRATRLLQPSPYSDRGSAEALALAGQSGALWREVKRLSAELQEVRRERDEARADWRCLSDGLAAALEMDPDHPMPMAMLASVRALAKLVEELAEDGLEVAS